MDINEWIGQLTGDTARDIARHTGISERTLQHQLSTGRMSVENAVKISAAYGRHPLRTLIDFGIVDAAWAQVPDIDAALDLATDDKLMQEHGMELLGVVEDLPEWVRLGRTAWPKCYEVIGDGDAAKGKAVIDVVLAKKEALAKK